MLHCKLRSPRMSPSRAPVFSRVHYFQAPATQAIFLGKSQSKRLHCVAIILIRISLSKPLHAMVISCCMWSVPGPPFCPLTSAISLTICDIARRQ